MDGWVDDGLRIYCFLDLKCLIKMVTYIRFAAPLRCKFTLILASDVLGIVLLSCYMLVAKVQQRISLSGTQAWNK